MKFILDAALSCQVKDWARDHLGVDTNCFADGGDAYDINTVYLDTPELDLFHRTGIVGQTKHRIRRYGNEQLVWLETKRKKKMVVRKNRTVVFESDLMARVGSDGAHTWSGDWFLKRVADRRLQPAIQIAYRRFARTSTFGGESLRLTIDSEMNARPIDDWSIASSSQNDLQHRLPFGEHEILELKFNNHMPHLFKELLSTFEIPETGFSKYRTATHLMTAKECLINV
jgi:hypothetical protein